MGNFWSAIDNHENLNDLEIIKNNNKTNKFLNDFRDTFKDELNYIEEEDEKLITNDKNEIKLNLYKKLIYDTALKNIQEQLMEKFNFNELNELLKKTNSLITGSFTLCSIFKTSNFKYNDIDIFTENPKELLDYFDFKEVNKKYSDIEENKKYSNMEENKKYSNSGKIKNFIKNVFNINYNGFKIQIIEIQCMEYYIGKYFDLDCCKFCYDGEILKTYGSKNIYKLLIETSKGETSFNTELYDINKKQDRLNKYSLRGFKINNI